jgi:peptidoglycan-associated lipoprotein
MVYNRIFFLSSVAFRAILAVTVFWFFISSTSCTFTQKIRDGQTAFELRQYALAARLYQQEFERETKTQDKARIAFELGQTHKALRQFDESLQWFRKSDQLGFGPEATLMHARLLVIHENYNDAVKFFTEAGKKQNNERLYLADIQAARTAADWLTNASTNEHKIKLLSFNSPFFDFSPMPYERGQLIFTSDRNQSVGNRYYKMTGNKFSSLFLANVNNSSADRFEDIFNSNFNDASLALNFNQTIAVFIRCGSDTQADDYCQLYKSLFEFGTWSKPEIMDFVKPGINYRTPAFSPDGKLLLFAADGEGSSGGFDLYVSEYFQGVWQEPVSIAGNINTAFNEISPFMHYDTLYFASDRTGGMGGYDIYRTFLLDGKWTQVQNLKAPINSGADDLNFCIDTFSFKSGDDKIGGYFVSNRKGGLGADDIYFFERLFPKPDLDDLAKKAADEALKRKYILQLNLITQEKEFNVPDDPNSGIRFRKPMGMTRVKVYENGALWLDTFSNNLGALTLMLQKDVEYRFVGSKDGYLSNESVLQTPMEIDDKQRILESRLLLEKIYYNKEIVLDNIYYDFDRWEIRSDARPILDSLAQLLRITPDIRIKLGSHTDCRGSEQYNMDLSQKRAEAAVAYLIQQGIDSRRLEAEGYGESKPIAVCICELCSEEEHQLNRRTTFAIIE